MTKKTPKYNYQCRDCGKKIIMDGDKMTNGKLLGFDTENDKSDLTYIVKCNECFEKDPTLRNYKECEVYSRVVGYLRPVQQWNISKQEEFKERKTYKEK